MCIVLALFLSSEGALLSGMDVATSAPSLLKEGFLMIVPAQTVKNLEYRRCNAIIQVGNYYLYRGYAGDDFCLVYVQNMAVDYGSETKYGHTMATWNYTVDSKKFTTAPSCFFFDLPSPHVVTIVSSDEHKRAKIRAKNQEQLCRRQQEQNVIKWSIKKEPRWCGKRV